MCAIYLTETPWDIAPDNTSKFEIYEPSDQYILGNAVDRLKKYDGSQFENLDGGAPSGNILAIYKDRLLVAGDAGYPHRIWFSHIRNGEGWSLDNDWLEVYPEDGGKINGFGIQDDELIISKDNGKQYGWRIFEDGLPENSRLRIVDNDKGFVNKEAIAVLDNVLYYLDRDRLDTIPARNRGGLSYIVDEVIAGIQSFNNTAMGSNDGRVYVALGDITIDIGDEVSLSDAVLVYDSINEAFYIRDNVNAKVFSKFISSDSQEKIYFGDESGRVFKLEDGNTAGGNPIHMRLRTKAFFRELGENIHLKKVGIYMDDPDATVVNYRTSLNEKFSKSLGTVTKEPVHWFEVDITGPLFQLEFTHSNVNARPRLLGIDIDYVKQGDAE